MAIAEEGRQRQRCNTNMENGRQKTKFEEIRKDRRWRHRMKVKDDVGKVTKKTETENKDGKWKTKMEIKEWSFINFVTELLALARPFPYSLFMHRQAWFSVQTNVTLFTFLPEFPRGQ